MVINPKTWWKSIVREELEGEELVAAAAASEPDVIEEVEVPEEIEEEDDDEEEFETAYDLDEGAPFRAARPVEHTNVRPEKSLVRSAKEFFTTEVIYRFDVLEDSQREALRGKYCFELKGAGGGVWTVIIEDELEVVNRKEEADSVIQMKQSDFVHLTNGDLNPQMGIMAQKIKVLGDIDKALDVNLILTPEPD